MIYAWYVTHAITLKRFTNRIVYEKDNRLQLFTYIYQDMRNEMYKKTMLKNIKGRLIIEKKNVRR